MERRNSTVHLLIAVLAALFPAAVPLHAQQSDRAAEVHLRNQCRMAAQVIRTGHPDAKRDWARRQIPSCPEEGPAILAEQWRTLRADTGQVEWLRFHSSRIRDQRLYDQLRQTVSDRSRPDLVRVAAMLVLSKYVDPYSAVWFSDLRPPSDTVTRIPLVGGSTTAGGQIDGSNPLIGHVAPAVQELLEQVSAQRTAETRAVWYAAAVLAKRVKFDIASGRAR
jgi:hypothetical protein